MMKRINTLATFLICFGFVLNSTAQTNTDEYTYQLFWSPIRLIDISNPGLEIGLAVAHNQKFTTQVSAGFMRDLLGAGDHEHYRGHRLAIEEKYFVHTHKKMRYFLSAEWVHLHCRFQHTDYFKEPLPELEKSGNTDLSQEYSETYDIRKTTNSLNIRFGFQFAYKRFVMEVSGGIGLKHKNVNHYGRTSPLEWRDNRFFNMRNLNTRDDITWTGNLPFNFRIGYRF